MTPHSPLVVKLRAPACEIVVETRRWSVIHRGSRASHAPILATSGKFWKNRHNFTQLKVHQHSLWMIDSRVLKKFRPNAPDLRGGGTKDLRASILCNLPLSARHGQPQPLPFNDCDLYRGERGRPPGRGSLFKDLF